MAANNKPANAPANNKPASASANVPASNQNLNKLSTKELTTLLNEVGPASNKPANNKPANNKPGSNNKWKHVTNLNSTEEHMLDDHGYKNVMSLSKEQRKDAIMSIIKHLTPIKGQFPTMLYIITALNARYLFYRVTDPALAKIFKTDQRMVTSMHRRMKRTAKRLMHTNSKHANAV